MNRISILLFVWALLACSHKDNPTDNSSTGYPDGDIGIPVSWVIDSSDICRDQLPTEFDTSKTYYYMGPVNTPADSLINLLIDSGFMVKQAWLPLDYMCLDPLGPRFTVELKVTNDNILDYDFVKGVSRLFCSNKLRWYQIFEIPVGWAIDSSEITRDQLPAEFDTSKTYFYMGSIDTSPDSLISLLMRSGLLINKAWLALDNMCLDPIGPRFTVELTTSDDRILNYDFVKGVGRLYCASRLRMYQIIVATP